MAKISKIKFIPLVCLLSNLSGFAFASDVHLLDINVFSWSLLQRGNQGGKNFVKHIIANKYDFVTTQEADAASLLDPSFGDLRSDYALVGGTNQDANIYYNDKIWRLDKMEIFDTTPDDLTSGGKGKRIALLGKFHNIQDDNKEITVVTTHLCVAWSSSRGCVGDSQYNAHVKDVQNIASEISKFSGNAPVIFSGDFNNIDDIVNQTQDIKNKLANNSLSYINYGDNPSPVWAYNNPIDFTFFNNIHQDGYAKGYMKNAYQPDGGTNLSDHDGIDVSFNFGDTPPPISCAAPTINDIISKSFDGKNVEITFKQPDTNKQIELHNYLDQKIWSSTPQSYEFSDLNVGPASQYDYSIYNVCNNVKSLAYKFSVYK